MIPNAYIQAWRASAPWPDARQVEQDLIICRALCDLFNAPALKGKIAFRGGTAINKLLFKRSLRYSEDIDLVQTTPEPIGATVDGVRDALSWLGKCKRDHAGHSMHMIFKFTPETDTQNALKLKVEINTREHQSALGIKEYPFAVDNGWYQGDVEIASFAPEEMFGTKLRAVEGRPITRAVAEQRMLEKLTRSLTEDIAPLLPMGIRFNDDDAVRAFERVWKELIARLSGDSWKLTDKALDELRSKKYPNLLYG